MFPPVENRQALYHRIIVRAQDVFQRRLRKVEVELAQAQLDLHALEIRDHALATDRRLAVVMGGHACLGRNSLLNLLPDEILHAIILQAVAI